MAAKGQVKVGKWYHGGLASAAAASITHPLDLLKVQMQTQKGKNISALHLVRVVLKNEGILGLYNGISASILRQLTYSLTRFAMYEASKQHLTPKDGRPIPFYLSMGIAGVSGLAGGFVGNPADLVNVRMQNDIKLPAEQRRNYRHALHGIFSVAKNEGILQLWAGSSMSCTRAVLMTIGQLSFYDKIKQLLMSTSYFEDCVPTHVTAAVMAGGVATTLTQPADVLKTRAMNAPKGEVKSMLTLLVATAKENPLALFKGYVPAFVRLAPHTTLTFVFLEQLKQRFGDDVIFK